MKFGRENTTVDLWVANFGERKAQIAYGNIDTRPFDCRLNMFQLIYECHFSHRTHTSETIIQAQAAQLNSLNDNQTNGDTGEGNAMFFNYFFFNSVFVFFESFNHWVLLKGDAEVELFLLLFTRVLIISCGLNHFNWVVFIIFLDEYGSSCNLFQK